MTGFTTVSAELRRSVSAAVRNQGARAIQFERRGGKGGSRGRLLGSVALKGVSV